MLEGRPDSRAASYPGYNYGGCGYGGGYGNDYNCYNGYGHFEQNLKRS